MFSIVNIETFLDAVSKNKIVLDLGDKILVVFKRDDVFFISDFISNNRVVGLDYFEQLFSNNIVYMGEL